MDDGEDGNAGHAKDAGDFGEDENETIEDRVFICVGRYKHKVLNRGDQAVWVMTIDKDFQVVTLWNAVQHKEQELRGRIDRD